jgi:hypothetical protein
MSASAALGSVAPRLIAQRKLEIVPAAELPIFQAQLLGWFAKAKRDLDWRRTRDAYCVWISEIMLQQTRVAAVLPYYRRFLERFPTIDALARARPEAVLRSWAGLGEAGRDPPRRRVPKTNRGSSGAARDRALHGRGRVEHCLRRAARGA